MAAADSTSLRRSTARQYEYTCTVGFRSDRRDVEDRTPYKSMTDHHDPAAGGALKRRKTRRTERTKRRANKRKSAAAGGARDSGPIQDAQSGATAAYTSTSNVHAQGQNQPAVTAPISAQMPAQVPPAMQMQMQGGMHMHSAAAASGQHNFPPPPPHQAQAQAHGMQQGYYVQGCMHPPPVAQMQQGYVSYGPWGMPPPHVHSTFEAGVAEGRRQAWAQMQAQAQAEMDRHQWAGQHQWADQHQRYQPNYMYQLQPPQPNYMHLHQQYQHDYQHQEYQRNQHYHQNQYCHQNQHQLQQQQGDDTVAADGSRSAPRVADGAAARDEEAHGQEEEEDAKFHVANGGKAELGDDGNTASMSSDANKKEDNASRNSAKSREGNKTEKASNAAERNPSKQSQQSKGVTKLTLPDAGVDPTTCTPTSTANVATTEVGTAEKSDSRSESMPARTLSACIDSAMSADTVTTSEITDLSTPQDAADTDRPRATSREKSKEKKKKKKKKKRPKKNTVSPSTPEEATEFQTAAVDAAACRPSEMSSDTEGDDVSGPVPPIVETILGICIAECARRRTQKLRLEDGRSGRAFVDPDEVQQDLDFMVLLKEKCRAAHHRLYGGKSGKNRRGKNKAATVTVDLSPSYDFRIVINGADVEKVVQDPDELDRIMADRNESEERAREVKEKEEEQQKEAAEKAQLIKMLVSKVEHIKRTAQRFRSNGTESRYCISGMVDLDHTCELFYESIEFSPSVDVKTCLKGVLDLLTDALYVYRRSQNVGHCNVLEALTLVSPLGDRPHLNPDLVGAIFSRVDVKDGLFFLDNEPIAKAKKRRLGEDLGHLKRELALQSKDAKEAALLLGVPTGADAVMIKREFRKLSIRWHPDKCVANNMTLEEANEKFTALSAARELLLGYTESAC